MSVHIHCDGDDIDVTGALPVAEECSFDSVRARQNAEFGVCYRASAVVMWMQGYLHAVAVFEIVVHILYLIGIDVRHRKRHGYRQVDYHRTVGGGLPFVEHRVADFKRKFGLGSGEGFGRVFKADVILASRGVFIEEPRALKRDIDYFVFRFSEHLLTLCKRGGIVKVDYRVFYAVQSFKSLLYNMLARLGQHLHGDVVGDHIVFYKGA